jgi:hypothetical protein
LIKPDGVSLSAVAKNAAKALTRCTKDKVNTGMQNPDVYKVRSLFTKDTKPLNYHFLDVDVVKVLRNCYSVFDKAALMDDDEVMGQFFGSATVGRNILGEIDDDDWEDLLEDEGAE